MKLTLSFVSSRFDAWPKSQDKNLNILITKRAFEVKWKSFFSIFKGVLVAWNCLTWGCAFKLTLIDRSFIPLFSFSFLKMNFLCYLWKEWFDYDDPNAITTITKNIRNLFQIKIYSFLYENDIASKKIDADFFGKQGWTECRVKPIISMIPKIFNKI